MVFSSDSMNKARVSGVLFGKTAAIVAISFILLWLHAPALHFHFWYDDFAHLYASSVESWENIVSNFHPTQPGWAAGEFLPFYRPLSHRTYFGLMRLIFGLDPFYYHSVCLVLMALISFNIYVMISLLSGDKLASFFGSVLFASGTSHAVSQLWVSVTPDLMVVFLMTTSFNAYLLSMKKGRLLFRAISAALFVLALLAKEAAIVVPGFLFLLEMLYTRPLKATEIKRLSVRLAPFALIAAAYLTFRMMFFDLPKSGPYGVSFGLFVPMHLGQYFLIAMNDFLAGFLNVPDIDIIHKAGGHGMTNWWLASVKFLVVVVAVVCLSWWQKWEPAREVVFSSGWFIMGLLPVIFLQHHFYLYYLLPATPGMMLVVGRVLGHAARALGARSLPAAIILCLLAYALIFSDSTRVMRREQAVLRHVTLELQSIEEQLVRQLPNPPRESSFIFSGDYCGGWWRDLTPAIQVIYGKPDLYAADIGETDLVTLAMKLPYPVYFVHVAGRSVFVSRKK